ncbi:hypothetical protein D9M68_852140 [compost metagenome]
MAPMATGMPASRPCAIASEGRSVPITSPLGTSGPKACGDRSAMPEAAKARGDQVPVATEMRPAVLASLASVAISPVSRKPR